MAKTLAARHHPYCRSGDFGGNLRLITGSLIFGVLFGGDTKAPFRRVISDKRASR